MRNLGKKLNFGLYYKRLRNDNIGYWHYIFLGKKRFYWETRAYVYDYTRDFIDAVQSMMVRSRQILRNKIKNNEKFG